ncbi:hypothetical protein J6590_033830 [Homalodisca vitripennis]|nr:hypothetical protein J6590_033830 [Homalodisca vitripennis]
MGGSDPLMAMSLESSIRGPTVIKQEHETRTVASANGKGNPHIGEEFNTAGELSSDFSPTNHFQGSGETFDSWISRGLPSFNPERSPRFSKRPLHYLSTDQSSYLADRQHGSVSHGDDNRRARPSTACGMRDFSSSSHRVLSLGLYSNCWRHIVTTIVSLCQWNKPSQVFSHYLPVCYRNQSLERYCTFGTPILMTPIMDLALCADNALFCFKFMLSLMIRVIDLYADDSRQS